MFTTSRRKGMGEYVMGIQSENGAPSPKDGKEAGGGDLNSGVKPNS